MHKEILTKNQQKLLPFVKDFSNNYYLVGGTAVALYIGHRRSIDFDLFSDKAIDRGDIKRLIEHNDLSIQKTIFEAHDQLHLIIEDVKFTFMQFPFKIEANTNFNTIINLPALIDLATMKSYALGGRAKWKDYVDLYFLLKFHFNLDEIISRAKKIFCNYFNEKLFLEQLSYFDDIDESEKIEFMCEPVNDDEIKNFLIDVATQTF